MPIWEQKLSGDSEDLEFSTDGAFLYTACASPGAIQIWDVATQRLVRESTSGVHTYIVYAIRLSRDGRQLLTSGGDNKVVLRDAKTLGSIREVTEHKGWATDAIFSADESEVISASRDGTIRVTSLHGPVRNQPRLTIDVGRLCPQEKWFPGTCYALAVSPDGTILFAGGGDGNLRSFAMVDGRLLNSVNVGSVITGLAACGTEFASNSSGGSVSLWSFADGSAIDVLGRYEGSPDTGNLDASPDGRWLAAAGGFSGLTIFDRKTRDKRIISSHPRRLTACRFSPCGRWLAWSIESGELIVCNAHNL